MIFSEENVKLNPRFFIAGRGGETNNHPPNHTVRNIILASGSVYASLNMRQRGQKFVQSLLDEKLTGFTFVVGISYFLRNHNKGIIADVKVKSIIAEHGSIQALKALPSTSYVTIGKEWTFNIIGAILREAARRSKNAGKGHGLAVKKGQKTRAPIGRIVEKKAVGKKMQRKERSTRKDTPSFEGGVTDFALDTPPVIYQSNGFQVHKIEAKLLDCVQGEPMSYFSDVVPIVEASESTMSTGGFTAHYPPTDHLVPVEEPPPLYGRFYPIVTTKDLLDIDLQDWDMETSNQFQLHGVLTTK